MIRGALAHRSKAGQWYQMAENTFSSHERAAAAASGAWARAELSAAPIEPAQQRFRALGIRDGHAMRRLWIA